MRTNNLRSRREKADLTQKAVADAVGISQQHLQRLETGTSPVRLPIAEKIADSLSTTIEDLFPQLAEVVRRDHALVSKNDPEARKMIDEWERAGIDIDTGVWRVYWRIGQHGTFFATVSSSTARRLIDESEGKATSGFLVFDSATHRYAVALHEDVEMEFQREPGADEMEDDETLPSEYRRVKVYSSGRNSWREYYVDLDEAVLYEEPKKRTGMQALFAALESGSRPRVSIVSRHDDQSFEEATLSFIPVDSILSVEAPLSVVDPAFRKAMEEGRKPMA